MKAEDWINVYDKMPKIDEDVMIYYEAYNIPHSVEQKVERWSVICLGHFNGEEWFHSDKMRARVWYRVTHWMPIVLPKNG